MSQPSTPRGYPPDRYQGAGERSARLRPAVAEPEVGYPHGATCEFLATGADTDGQFGLHRWTFGERETGPAPHFHRAISESFYVLEGRVRLYDGDAWRVATAGDFLHVPHGGVHGFKGCALARMLVMFTPGAPREEYVETLEQVERGRPMTDAERVEFMLRHDTYWV